MRRLEFLVGESSGYQTLYPPGSDPVQYLAVCSITREQCDRFLELRFFASVPGFGPCSITALLGYSMSKGCYEMWLFSSGSEQPMHLSGDFQGDKLVLVSEPWNMSFGLQKFRITFSPFGESVEYLSETWSLEGYQKFNSVIFGRQRVEA